MARITKLTQKCAKCGSCAQVCPVYLQTGRESHCARGKLHLFNKEADYSSEYFNALLAKCIQCGACDDSCPRNLAPSKIIRGLRAKQSIGQTAKGYTTYLSRKILSTPSLLKMAEQTLPLLQKLPLASGLRKKITMLIPHSNELTPKAIPTAQQPLLYYPGCLAHYFQTDIEQATTYLASLCGYKLTIPPTVSCCGLASNSSGKLHEAQQQAYTNITAFEANNAPILTSCGSCFAMLKSYPDLFEKDSTKHKAAIAFAHRVQELSTFFLKEDKLVGIATKQAVYYHDPCHLRFAKNEIIEAPRQLIWNINGTEALNKDRPLGCCGQGGLFALTNPTISEGIFTEAEKKIDLKSSATMVTSCSSCLMGWQQMTEKKPLSSQHLSVFLAKNCKNC